MKKSNDVKREIAELKWILEDPSYPFSDRNRDEDMKRLSSLREELKLAILTEGSGDNGAEPSADSMDDGENKSGRAVFVDEERLATYEKKLPYIKSVMLNVDGFYSGVRSFTAIIEPACVRVLRESGNAERAERARSSVGFASLSRSEFFSALDELCLGEWQESYDPERYGAFASDGIKWRLEITYKGRRRSFVSHGNNLFPFNYNKLLELMTSLSP